MCICNLTNYPFKICPLIKEYRGGFLIESKDRKQPQGIEPVAKLRYRLERRPPGTMGIFFSTGGFTPAAELFSQFSSPMNVVFWGDNDFDYALRHGKMAEILFCKMQYAIQHGLPQIDCEALLR